MGLDSSIGGVDVMHVDYDSWKLAGPPEADHEVLKDISCSKCDWEGDAYADIIGSNLTWECPGCEHEHHEDPEDRFGEPEDWKDDK
jgi:hypothetical protein